MSHNPYLEYVNQCSAVFGNGKSLPLGDFPPPPAPVLIEDAPKVAILAPHPDDECVMGGLPLRLMREAGCKVINFPITYGSNPLRKKERADELAITCKWIGFDLVNLCPNGLEKIYPKTRSENLSEWEKAVEILAKALSQHRPDILFFPNANDWNQTHLGVNLLTMDALTAVNPHRITLVETEFWGQTKAPNLLVENSIQEVADLVGALSHHRGEVLRNPFHLRLVSWMQDNVRRGSEVVGGQGKPSPEFDFATLYRVSKWEDGNAYKPWDEGKFLAKARDPQHSILASLNSA